MAHGFGQSIDEQKADELCKVAQTKGYDTILNDTVLTLTNQYGFCLIVETIDSKYIVHRIDKHIGYKSMGATMKGIATAFNMLLNESNKQYE